MPNFPETAKPVFDFLKGQGNPFESLARPQRLDDQFLDLHMPELLARERQLLLAMIDRYRVTNYHGAADMQPTRVVTILGDRGSGKTHLLRSLQYGKDGQTQLIIRPTYYEAALPFEEYLLDHLVRALTEEDEVYQSKALADIAAAMTRLLLRQALLALSPTDRLFFVSSRRWPCLRLLLGGGNGPSKRLDDLAHELEVVPARQDLLDLLESHGVQTAQGYRLLAGHLGRFEVGKSFLADVRRHLYLAMAKTALRLDAEALERFLGGEYLQAQPEPNTRFEIVAHLLHALTEVCTLVQLPIVLAFDNLERLFSPRGQPDANLIRTFLNNLAQAVDNTKGLLFFLFAESSLFDGQVVPNMDSFARDRLSQGVPLHAQGPVDVVRLKPPSTEEIGLLVDVRVRRLLAKEQAVDGLPAGFPFDSTSLQNITGTENQNLRVTLQRLRDEYSRVVYGRVPEAPVRPPVPPRPPDTAILLDSTWKKHLAAAGQKLTSSPVGQLSMLHEGLGRLLQAAHASGMQ